MSFLVEPLGSAHDRKGFACGVAALDFYLQRQARLDMERGVAAVFVLVDEAAPSAVAGYYTLSAFTVVTAELPEAWRKKLPRYPQLPATLLGRLARDLRHPDVGKLLLADALRRSYAARAHVGSLALVAEAKDEAARGFYLHFGFLPLGHHPQWVYLPLDSIGQLDGPS